MTRLTMRSMSSASGLDFLGSLQQVRARVSPNPNPIILTLT